MATLNNPISPQNMVDRYADFVTATANSGISWGTNAKPFSEMPDSNFGGTTGGRSISVSGSAVGTAGNSITAQTIYNSLVNETATYTNIRNLRALLFVEGAGGNTGSRPTPGYVYDATAVAHLNTNYRQGVGTPSASDVVLNNRITSGGLEQFYNNLTSSYNSARSNTASIQVNVCHASCHSSCHSSRSRR
jgi:hypothetical protein